jgi:hypothetical protein
LSGGVAGQGVGEARQRPEIGGAREGGLEAGLGNALGGVGEHQGECSGKQPRGAPRKSQVNDSHFTPPVKRNPTPNRVMIRPRGLRSR